MEGKTPLAYPELPVTPPRRLQKGGDLYLFPLHHPEEGLRLHPPKLGNCRPELPPRSHQHLPQTYCPRSRAFRREARTSSGRPPQPPARRASSRTPFSRRYVAWHRKEPLQTAFGPFSLSWLGSTSPKKPASPVSRESGLGLRSEKGISWSRRVLGRVTKMKSLSLHPPDCPSPPPRALCHGRRATMRFSSTHPSAHPQEDPWR